MSTSSHGAGPVGLKIPEGDDFIELTEEDVAENIIRQWRKARERDAKAPKASDEPEVW